MSVFLTSLAVVYSHIATTQSVVINLHGEYIVKPVFIILMID